VKRRRVLLGSNPPRNSRWKLIAMSNEADVQVHAGLILFGEAQARSFIAIDFRMPQKPILTGHFRNLTRRAHCTRRGYHPLSLFA
jgi:hypothetical protein